MTTHPLLTILCAGVCLALLTACDCELPDRWKGAALDGCSSAGDVTCCSYSDSQCTYTVCQTSCGDPEQSGWYCL